MQFLFAYQTHGLFEVLATLAVAWDAGHYSERGPINVLV